MKLTERKPSGREKDVAAVEHLAELRDKLHADDISIARKAAYNLSWMQEDGLDILKEALFGSFPRTAKKAATYGLRNMNGRMRKIATEVLTQGLTHDNRITQQACATALQLMKDGTSGKKIGLPRKPRPRRPGIREFRNRSRFRSQAPSESRPPADRRRQSDR